MANTINYNEAAKAVFPANQLIQQQQDTVTQWVKSYGGIVGKLLKTKSGKEMRWLQYRGCLDENTYLNLSVGITDTANSTTTVHDICTGPAYIKDWKYCQVRYDKTDEYGVHFVSFTPSWNIESACQHLLGTIQQRYADDPLVMQYVESVESVLVGKQHSINTLRKKLEEAEEKAKQVNLFSDLDKPKKATKKRCSGEIQGFIKSK